jgi:hypothetical protein
LERLRLLQYGEMECFQGIFLEAAKLHIKQMTTTKDTQVISTHRVLTSILIGYQTADAQSYKQWVTRLAVSTDAKGMLCNLMWQHELAPAYYMLGWQFAHEKKSVTFWSGAASWTLSGPEPTSEGGCARGTAQRGHATLRRRIPKRVEGNTSDLSFDQGPNQPTRIISTATNSNISPTTQ